MEKALNSIDQAISQLVSAKEYARKVDDLQMQVTESESKKVDLDIAVKALEEQKAKLLEEATKLRTEVEVLRNEKIAERKARSEIINQSNLEVSQLNDKVMALRGQHDQIASAIAELKGRLG